MTYLQHLHPNHPCYKEGRDDRADGEKLQDAIDLHLANEEKLQRIVAEASSFTDARVSHSFARAEQALEHSRADLFWLVEKLFEVDPDRLAKALAA